MTNNKNTAAMLLAAGLGTRLRPYTDEWPKCLMPIKNIPLLEYWIQILSDVGIEDITINMHHHAEIVQEFLNRPQFNQSIKTSYEATLLGTAATLRENASSFEDKTCLLVHADNLCCCDFMGFIDYHHYMRPSDTVMTMMTFESSTPSTCGIVELDNEGVVRGYHEKVVDPPSNLANAAVYLIEPEVIDWILVNIDAMDFSNEVIPKFIGRIATWKNTGVHRDIGSSTMLRAAQHDNCESIHFNNKDEWQTKFMSNPIHEQLKEIMHG